MCSHQRYCSFIVYLGVFLFEKNFVESVWKRQICVSIAMILFRGYIVLLCFDVWLLCMYVCSFESHLCLVSIVSMLERGSRPAYITRCSAFPMSHD